MRQSHEERLRRQRWTDMIARANGATHDCGLCGRPITRAGYCVGCEADLDHAQDDYFHALNQEEA